MKIIEKINAKNKNIYENNPVTIAFLGDSVTQGCFECYLTSPTTLDTVFIPPDPLPPAQTICRPTTFAETAPGTAP